MKRMTLWILLQLIACPCITATPYTDAPKTFHDILSQECTEEEYTLCSRMLDERSLAYEEAYAAIDKIANILEKRHTELSDQFVTDLVNYLEDEAQKLHNSSAYKDTKAVKTTRSISTPVSGTKIQFGSGNIDGADTIGANALQNDTGLTLDYSQGSTSNQTLNVNKNGSAVITIDDATPHVKIQDRQLDMGTNNISNVGTASMGTLNTDSLSDNGSGQVSMGNTLDLNGNNITDGTGNITAGSAVDLNGNNLTDGTGDVTLGSALDANGNAVKDSSNILTLDGAGNKVQISSNTSGGLDLNGNNIVDNGGTITIGDTLEVGSNAIQSATTDSSLTITQDSNSSDGTAENLTIETIDSSANNAVGNIILSADSGNTSAADIIFNTSTTDRARIDSNGLNVDNLSDNGTGQISMGNTLDLNGNNITDGTGNITAGSAVDLNGNNLTDGTGDVTLGSSINANSNNINTLSTLSGSNGSNLTVQNATASNTSDDTITILLDATETEDSGATGGSGDTANIELNVGTNNGNLKAPNLKSGTGTALVIDSNNNILSDSSSEKFKRNIRACEDDIVEKAMKLQPVRFVRISTEEEEIGLVAEDVDKVLPEIVTYDADDEPYSIMYHRVGPIVLKAVQQQQKRLEHQDAIITQQQAQIQELYEQYASLQHEVQMLREVVRELIQ